MERLESIGAKYHFEAPDPGDVAINEWQGPLDDEHFLRLAELRRYPDHAEVSGRTRPGVSADSALGTK